MFYYEIRKAVWQFVENHWDTNKTRYELQLKLYKAVLSL